MIQICHKISTNKIFNRITTASVIYAILSFIISTELDEIGNNKYFKAIDIYIGTLFCAEIAIRVLGSRSPKKEIGRMLTLMDILATVSFFTPYNLSYLRSFRILKTMRIFRKRRYQIAAIAIRRVWRLEKEEIILASLFFFILIFLSSSIMHVLEGEIQDSLSSIPRCMYWAFITATGVGYGDIAPVTPGGKILAIITATLGVLTYSMVTVIFATGFSKELKVTQYLEFHRKSQKKDQNT